MIRSNIVTKYINLSTQGENDIIDITNNVKKILLENQLKNGIITLFIVGSTAAITTIEFESGLTKDFPNMLERIAPMILNMNMIKLGMMATVMIIFGVFSNIPFRFNDFINWNIFKFFRIHFLLLYLGKF